jgi:histidinol-phosphate aminotransferase
VPISPKPWLADLRPGVHGSFDYAELARFGLRPEEVTDFSVSVNPFGPPLVVREAVAKADYEHYPDSRAGTLVRALALRLDVPEWNILAGSGSSELIRLVAQAYLGPGDRALAPVPTYGDYAVACRTLGADLLEVPRAGPPDFRLSVDDIITAVRKATPKVVFICNPNNPTGQYFKRREIESILESAGDSLVVVDEAYAAFVDERWDSASLINRGNLVLLRSMTKDYALAGARLGYLLAPSEIIRVLAGLQAPWSLNAGAQAAGLAVLGDDAYLPRCAANIRKAKAFLIGNLLELGLKPVPSAANYFLVQVHDAADLRGRLLRRRVLVRDCTSFGLSGYIRLGVRTIPECRKLLEALRAEKAAED